ncbi:MAG TPA: monovalent cation:proton antiporter-2 (CPA2) family protein [Alphaproteobacteria bacterium]|nr:monovalent cation:proton antiporter-2 (CPA2) family protein [Alphaproteobacteria bacterium]
MTENYLFTGFVFLMAACLMVPLVSRFKLGSVLGYLAAGVIIGPFGLGLIADPTQVMSFAEFGVVMMLFIIGLELEPAMLWKMRHNIVGLGGLQVALTSAAFTAIGIAMGFGWQVSLACGMALSLSSTALVVQMLQEKGLLQTNAGESSFAVLLFQDIAVILILIVMPLLGSDLGAAKPVAHESLLHGLPGWVHTLAVAGVIGAIVLGGRYVSGSLFKYIAKTNLREVFTATSLALVIGIALLMELVGISPALGAFIAGVVLATSDYKHTLETDIEPFKGLLLGLFFISVGMGINFPLFSQHPWALVGTVAALVVVKATIMLGLAHVFRLRGAPGVLFALALAHGGEFAFVLFQFAGGLQIITPEQSAFLTMVVALSMATMPFLMLFNDKFVQPRFMSLLPPRPFDTITNDGHPVIIAGYGRFGQIIGRFLSGQGVKITVLEKDPDQIDLLRQFGTRGYFGDASRLDVLKSAGAGQARLLIVAIENADKCLEIVRMAKKAFPKLQIMARARNRRHAYELHMAGVDYFRREAFDASLAMGREAMIRLGYNPATIDYKARQFRQHDERTLLESFAFYEQEPVLINFARQASEELKRILIEDIQIETPAKPAVVRKLHKGNKAKGAK